MTGFIKQIVTWWNRQTVGTFIYTFFTGKFVGKDQFGNKYYLIPKEKDGQFIKTKLNHRQFLQSGICGYIF
jgi:NADH:ubiquinone oxidoreductase subunit